MGGHIGKTLQLGGIIHVPSLLLIHLVQTVLSHLRMGLLLLLVSSLFVGLLLFVGCLLIVGE